jgi:2-polyprenyl-6-methoxyphenol hydroxylase-like FAD-dependent oxidoreductase
LAAFLNDSDIDYEIIEKASDWSHQGYSMSLWNNGRNILKKLGLAEIFDKHSKPIQNYYIYNGKGNLLKKYNLSHFYAKYGMALSLVNRLDIHNWLMSKINTSKVRLNLSISSITQREDKVSVGFSDGTSKDYDLVVGADGIHSTVRKLTFKENVEKSSIWRVWYMWIDNKYRTEAAVTEYIEKGEFISIFDSGEKTLAIISALSNGVLWDDPQGRIERLKKSFADESSLVPQMFESLKNENIIPTDLIHINLKKWFKGRVVLVGDAAHGFEPHAGIGGSMALEDGYILAGELMQISKNYFLNKALSNYETKRKKRVKVAYILTHKMKEWALTRSKLLRKIFDFFLPFFPEKYIVKDYYKLLDEEI